MRFKTPYEYENHVASLLPKHRREVASGALTGDYDVNGHGEYAHMIDCKLTEKKSFTIKEEDFKKLAKQAQDRTPAMFIAFQGGERIVVLRERDYVAYLQELEEG